MFVEIKFIESYLRSIGMLSEETDTTQYTGIHYSKIKGLGNLSGSMYGTGVKGAEFERIMNSPDKRLSKRVYFYLQQTPDTLPKPEPIVSGNYVYQATLDNIYDATTDPEKILKNKDPNVDIETAILDAGYDGYLNRNFMGGAIVVLGKDSVPVKYLGTRQEAQEKIGPITQYGKTKVIDTTPPIITFNKTSEGFESGMLKGDDAVFVIQNRDTLKHLFPTFRQQFGRVVFDTHEDVDGFIDWYKETSK